MTKPTYPVSTIANLFNLTERRVQQLASQNVIPKAERGKYDLVACVRGYISYLQDRAFGKDVQPVDAHQERARLIKAQADKTELEVQTLHRSLVSVEEAEMQWASLIVAFRSRMLAIPTRAAQALLALKEFHEIELFLREQIHEALNELSRYEPERMPDADPKGGEAGGTATEPESESVGGSVPPVK